MFLNEKIETAIILEKFDFHLLAQKNNLCQKQ